MSEFDNITINHISYNNGYKQGYEDAKKEFKPKSGEWKEVNAPTGFTGTVFQCPFCRMLQRESSLHCPVCGASLRTREPK